jgi:hypothetical protein
MATMFRLTENIRGLHPCKSVAKNQLRIAFATPEYVTEDHFDGGLRGVVGCVDG